MNKVYLRRKINECDGGVAMPFQTLDNTSGMGNPQPAEMAASTGADQTNPKCMGSGDAFGIIHKKDFKHKKKNKKNDRK